MNSAAKHIVFDWNGTLLDDFEPMFSCTNLLLESEGHAPVTAEAFRDRYTIPFRGFYDGMGFSEDQIDKLMSLENNAFHDAYEPLANLAGLRRGADEILSHAEQHGIHRYILSNHITVPIRNQLRRFAVEHLFSEIIAYANRAVQFRDGTTKGDKLRRFMAEHKIDPASTMIVGDSVEEIHIAREQGLISVAITGGCVSEKRLRAEKPDHVIHDLHELKPVLQERGFAP